jgi:hypothetical protein
LPAATRRPATSLPREPSSSGLIAVPIFAPIIRAIAAFSGKTPLPVSDMTSNATATLEWAAQAIIAPNSAEIAGSVAIPGHEDSKTENILITRHDLEQPGQCDQHQAKAYRYPSEIASSSRACPKRDHSDKQEERRKRGDVEGQHLHDQRRADVRAEHRRERWDQRDETARGEGGNHEAGRRAALKNRRDAEPRGESLQPSAKSPRQDSPELAAERALHAALHHVHAPKQQGDSASKVEEGQSPIHRITHPLFGGPPSRVRPA